MSGGIKMMTLNQVQTSDELMRVVFRSTINCQDADIVYFQD